MSDQAPTGCGGFDAGEHNLCRACGFCWEEHPEVTLVTSEALMFAENAGIPWPEERPYEQVLSPDELED